jgi:hypothetical protein
MNTMSHYRPSKRPSVKDVSKWYVCYENDLDLSWRGQGELWVMIERGYPFPDFYRVTYTIDGVKKSKLFYGESAWSQTEMFVYDMGFRDCIGVL